MKSTVVTVVAAAIVSLSLIAPAVAETTYESYKDQFNSVSYSGSEGTIPWVPEWIEIGEFSGPETGSVYVAPNPYCADYQCLTFAEDGEIVGTLGVKRSANLADFGDADLCYDLKADLVEDVENPSDGDLLIQVRGDGGTWKTIDSFSFANLDGNPTHRSKGVGNWLTAGFEFRFVVVGVLNGRVFIDNVEIKGSLAPEPTITTTTEPTPTTTIDEVTTTTDSKPTTTTTSHSTTTTIDSTTTTRLSTTTTTTAETTTTSIRGTTTTSTAGNVIPTDEPPQSGLRATASGIQANYSRDLFGSVEPARPEVMSIGLSADYRTAYEVIESTWIWMLALGMVIATAVVCGLDRRRKDRFTRSA